ncbi:hypothetical protein GCM10007416_16590 [Kroppenstedtia guangzhouensis]|uniref:VOC domain-containing protein n=1 Tax=Kroppenstedtia guangzhouensis TaxID=1274356 RepID=A0ABQ1GHW5_9BACL|nr:glyoxalase/bleomycin resistance/dioxygenase family protein [Kroppenstedtia guangzhouensis]GGA44123.1 hypothetical protein GCM10007416_16590 [Kroppenstedtia guangzhouensis]
MTDRHPLIRGLHAVVLIVKDLEEQKIALFAQGHHREGTQRLEGAAKGISHLEFTIDPQDAQAWDRRLKQAGFHAYRSNYEDADGNLFHFVFAASKEQ